MVIGETYNQCRQAWDELIKLLTDLGFAIDGKKVVAPTTNLTFLGIHMDTEACQLLLPQEKLTEIRSGLDHFVGQIGQIQLLGSLILQPKSSVEGVHFYVEFWIA